MKLVEADCVGALFASFARQKGRKFGDDTRMHHLKLLLQLAPKGGVGSTSTVMFVEEVTCLCASGGPSLYTSSGLSLYIK